MNAEDALLNFQFDDKYFPESLTKEYRIDECISRTPRCRTLRLTALSGGGTFIARCIEGSDDDGIIMREYRLLSVLDHDGVPKVNGVYRNGSVACLVREYVEGEPLDRYAASKKLTDAEIIAICVKICDILAYLHSQTPPVIHRDVKPQNVIIRPDGSPVLIDFGDARRHDDKKQYDTSVMGTAFFAAPEQYGFSQTDERSDIYAFGALLHWLLTGRTRGGRPGNRALDRIVRKCMAFSPKERYRSIKNVSRALTAAGKPRRITAARITAAVLAAALAASFIFIPPLSDALRGVFGTADGAAFTIPPGDRPSGLPESLTEPKIIVRTARTDGDWTLKFTCESPLYIDWGDGTARLHDDLNVFDVSAFSSPYLGDTVRIYSEGRITSFHCWSLFVTDIDVSGCPELEVLQFDDNRVTAIDLTNNRELREVCCPYNCLTSLRIRSDTELTELTCHYNYLDFSSLPLIDSLDGGDYLCSDQGNVTLPARTACGEELDLSYLAFAGDSPTEFRWYCGGVRIYPESSAPGKFIFGETYAGRSCSCVMTNPEFPALTLSTDETYIKAAE